MAPFELAYILLALIDAQLERGLHLRDTDGKLLTTLDQVVGAMEGGRWPCQI
jgi:hypothetical protein